MHNTFEIWEYYVYNFITYETLLEIDWGNPKNKARGEKAPSNITKPNI